MKIGLVPGAMKPYHAGHHYLTRQAMRECDHVIIITSEKDRKSISGANMRKAWENLIIPLLPSFVEVRFAKSPVGEVYDIIATANDRGDNVSFRIYGGTEDVARFPGEKLNARYGTNLGGTIVNVAEEQAGQFVRGQGNSPMAKGAWVREAIAAGDWKSFERMLPKFLKPHAEEYLSILVS